MESNCEILKNILNYSFEQVSQTIKPPACMVFIRGEVDATRLEAKAKNTKKFRGQSQGHSHKCSPKKKGLQNFFSGDLKKKRSSKNFFRRKTSSKTFFRRSLLEETKKRFLQIFGKVSGVFQRNFNGSNIVLSSSRGQGNFRGLEASRLRPRPRTSKCVLEDVLEAKDVHEDSTYGVYSWKRLGARSVSAYIS